MIRHVVVECESADDVLAVLVLRPDLAEPLPDGTSLKGVIRGPYSDYARTLPTEFELQQTDDAVLRSAVVDPCYSTDDLAMEYEVDIFSVRGDKCVGEYRTRVALRRKSGAAEH